MENEVKKEEQSAEQVAPLRQILIETNGKDVFLRKAEVSGIIELTAILQIILEYINRKPKNEVKKEEPAAENK